MSANIELTVTTHFLSLAKENWSPERVESPKGVELLPVTTPAPEFSQYLFKAVGGPWSWFSRLAWGYSEWAEHVEREDVFEWVAYKDGAPIGYFELNQTSDSAVEIKFIGVLPRMTGIGLGRWLTITAIEKAFELGGNKVWLHTCSEDHPNALTNYLSRGFVEERQETEADTMPCFDSVYWATPDFTTQYRKKFSK